MGADLTLVSLLSSFALFRRLKYITLLCINYESQYTSVYAVYKQTPIYVHLHLFSSAQKKQFQENGSLNVYGLQVYSYLFGVSSFSHCLEAKQKV